MIIATSSKGYKIPATVADILGYVRLSQSVILPMRDRLINARAQLRLLTNGELDIFEQAEFEALRKLVE